MLLVKTTIGPSILHGVGLFADQFIAKGAIIWRFVENFDLRFTKVELESSPEHAKEFLLRYAYLSHDTGYYVLCVDDARFYNHSDTPNTAGIDLDDTCNEGGDIATKDIRAGEEITCNYKVMDIDYKRKLNL